MKVAFFIASYFFSLASAELTSICIVAQENSHTSSSCDVNMTIQGLDQYLHETSPAQNITITLYSENILLDRLISIQNKTWISVDGHKNSPVITCNKTSSGFSFINVTNIALTNFEVRNCGADHNSTSKNMASQKKNLITRSAMFFGNSLDVTIMNVNVSHSDGTGIAMFDTSGSIHIENCIFMNNAIKKDSQNIPGGGGLYIELTYCTPGGITVGHCKQPNNRNLQPQNSHWVISRCTFELNNASSVWETFTSYIRNNFQGHGRGGGLGIILRGAAKNNTIDISDCNFTNNSAIWGGGLYISVQESSRNNIINVNSTTIENNIAYVHGGGGFDVGLLFNSENHSPTNNRIRFYQCDVVENVAYYGGGTTLYSSSSGKLSSSENEIIFEECRWIKNKAAVAAGVSVSPSFWEMLNNEFLLSPIFKNCLFQSNFIDSNLKYSMHEAIEGKGTIVAVRMDVKFEGTINFTCNTDTAFYLVSSTAKFSPNSNIHFENNSGKLGGAMCILGLSSLQIEDNSTFSFIDNSAREKGGAIYQLSQNINDYTMSRSCFIQYVGMETDVTQRRIHFNFKGNRVGSHNDQDSDMHTGLSIFAGTFEPCYTIRNDSNPLSSIATFSFEKDISLELSTAGESFNVTEGDKTVDIIPGSYLKLPTLIDEFQSEVSALYHIFILNKSQGSDISLRHDYSAKKSLKIYGSPWNQAELRIETVDMREVAVTLQIKLVDCPVGFHLTKINKKGTSCKCPNTLSMKFHTGIVDCHKNYTVKVRIGYWFGYEGKDEKWELKSAYCPYTDPYVNEEEGIIILPKISSKDELDRLICGNRTRKICAYCRENLSSHYHHPTFQCKSKDTCELGFLLYLISEILPITLFFLVIIAFNISCTHGALNGLIFYFQVVDTIINISNELGKCHPRLFQLTEIFGFVTGIFSLKFFYHSDLSFCLWEGAQTLDLLAFRYVTIIYSLLLVLMVIVTVRLCNVRKVTQKVFGREIGTKSTIIQGLSGFLVICYSESVRVSLMILTPVTVYTVYDRSKRTTAVLYNGELDYFRGKHLVYALPALFFIIVLGLGPPVLLLSYPLCYRVFGWLKIGESKFVKILCRCLPLEKFKPFYDYFQSSFKDEYRFFSGLYFAYRLIILLTYSITRSVTHFYTTLIIGFSIISCIHAAVQPYKKRWHNILDAYIFMILTILNTLSLYIYRRGLEVLNSESNIRVARILQTIVLYVPLVCFVLGLLKIVVVNLIKKLKSRQTKIVIIEHELTDSLLNYRRRNP